MFLFFIFLSNLHFLLLVWSWITAQWNIKLFRKLKLFWLFDKPGTGKLWFCYEEHVCAKLNSFCLSRSTFVCKIKNLLEEKLFWQNWQVTGLIELWAVPIVNFQVWFVSKASLTNQTLKRFYFVMNSSYVIFNSF
jgi:hypothetical protein